MSFKSLSLIAEAERPPPFLFKPLESYKSPPWITFEIIFELDIFSTFNSILPSSNRRISSTFNCFARLSYVVPTISFVPLSKGCLSSIVNISPFFKSIFESMNLVILIFGPCKSPTIPTW